MKSSSPEVNYHIVVATGEKNDFRPLLNMGYSIAKAHQGQLTIVTVQPTNEAPAWLKIPSSFYDIPIKINILKSRAAKETVAKYVKDVSPDLVLLGWKGAPDKLGYLLGSGLDPVLHQVACNLMVVKAEATWPEADYVNQETLQVLVPAAGGPNAPLAMDLALNASIKCEVTVLYITHAFDDEARKTERENYLAEIIAPWADRPNLKTKVIEADDVFQTIIDESKNYDVTMLGASNENVINKFLFGAMPQKIAAANDGTTVIVKQFKGVSEFSLRQVWWRITHILPSLSLEERVEVYKQVRRGARPKVDFFMMIGLATGIATLGLMLNSPAVIIGAMLVAPLMSAIMGLGLSMIQADLKLFRLAVSATFRGMLLAVGVGLLAGLLLPGTEPTPEILGRTEPSLFDLGIALVSGLAGAYALCRKDVSSSLPGVAIAAALVPPLGTVGIGVAWLELDIAQGALILFLTNLIAISAASAFVFFLLGFRPHFNQRGDFNVFGGGIVTSIILLILVAWVLWALSIDSFREARQARVIQRVLTEEVTRMDVPTRLEDWRREETDAADDPLKLELRVQSPVNPSHQSVLNLQERVAKALQKAGVLDQDDPLGLVMVTIRTNAIDPVVPPTPTNTLTSTRTPTPGPTQTPTSTATNTATTTATPTETRLPPTSTATPPPSPTFTVRPTSTDTPSPTFTPTPETAVVANTGGAGVRFWWNPGQIRAGAFPEGTRLTLLYETPVTIDGVTWLKVQDDLGRTGWVSAEFLVKLR